MPTKSKTTSKRELVEPHKDDKHYVRRKADGTFGKTVDVGKSLSADQKHKAKRKVPERSGRSRRPKNVALPSGDCRLTVGKYAH